jgi:signal transduction histidine kinase
LSESRSVLATRLRRAVLSTATGLSLRLGLASAALVSAAVAGAAVVAYRGEREQLVAATSQAAATQARLVRTGLEFAMLENNRSLVADLLEQYVQGAEVERISLFDSTGEIGFRAGPRLQGGAERLDPVLLAPGGLVAGATRTSTFIGAGDGRPILRALTPIPNDDRCHRCHPENQALLGVLAVDFNMDAVARARAAMVARTVRWSAGLFVLVLVGVGAVVHLGALRRLRLLRDATQLPDVEAPDPPDPPAGVWERDEIAEIAGKIQTVSSALRDSVTEIGLQRQFLQDLLDHIEDEVAIFDRSLRVVAVNAAYLQGAASARLEDDAGELRLAPGPASGASEECPTVRALRTGVVQRRLQERREGDEVAFHEVVASPLTDRLGRVHHVVELRRDVSERMAVEASLAHSEQLAAVGVLASGFSHEVATPLGTIGTSLQGVLRRLQGRSTLDEEDVAALRERLERAVGAVARCRGILRRLLDLSRKGRVLHGPVQVNDVVARVRELVRPTAEERRVALVTDLAQDLPAIRGHADDLERLLLNLAINALEAMTSGGRLSITTASEPEGVMLRVIDSGPGIPPGALPRIFEPFFSAKKSGTGLGLYLCRQIVLAHGGSIHVRSTPGCGAEFRVVLPARASAPSAAGAGASARA